MFDFNKFCIENISLIIAEVKEQARKNFTTGLYNRLYVSFYKASQGEISLWHFETTSEDYYPSSTRSSYSRAKDLEIYAWDGGKVSIDWVNTDWEGIFSFLTFDQIKHVSIKYEKTIPCIIENIEQYEYKFERGCWEKIKEKIWETYWKNSSEIINKAIAKKIRGH